MKTLSSCVNPNTREKIRFAAYLYSEHGNDIKKIASMMDSSTSTIYKYMRKGEFAEKCIELGEDIRIVNGKIVLKNVNKCSHGDYVKSEKLYFHLKENGVPPHKILVCMSKLVSCSYNSLTRWRRQIWEKHDD